MGYYEIRKVMEEYIKEVMERSKPKLEEFLKTKQISFYPSSANFLMLKIQNPDNIIESLKSKGILVRPKKDSNGKDAVRISIGTLKDTERFIGAFSEILDKGI